HGARHAGDARATWHAPSSAARARTLHARDVLVTLTLRRDATFSVTRRRRAIPSPSNDARRSPPNLSTTETTLQAPSLLHATTASRIRAAAAKDSIQPLLTASSSTSNMSVACGGITPPAPRLP